MKNLSLNKLLEERAKLLGELGTLSGILHGSWVERFSVCSRPDCKCRRGERHGPRRYLVINENGQQRQKYIQNDRTESAMKGLAQYHRLQEIVARMTSINLALMKEDDHKALSDSKESRVRI